MKIDLVIVNAILMLAVSGMALAGLTYAKSLMHARTKCECKCITVEKTTDVPPQ